MTLRQTENAEVVVISARAEEEISELDDADKQEFLEAIGITESELINLRVQLITCWDLAPISQLVKRSACLDLQTWHESSSSSWNHPL